MAHLGMLSGARRLAAAVPQSLSAGWLIAIGLVMHLVLATHAGMSPDEAHYALYGAHLDWSYFDHPPLAGWLQAPFVAAGGFDLLMRVVPMASWLLAVRTMIVLCRQLPLTSGSTQASAPRVDGWVVAMMLASPMLNLLGVALVPDTLLIVLVPAVMSATWRLRKADTAGQPWPWLCLSLLLGLCVLSKYTGLFVVLGAGLSLLRFHGSDILRMRGAWLCAAIVAASASPVLAWNLQHDWASISYQFAHAIGNQAWTIGAALRAMALQFALYGLLLPIAASRLLRLSEAEDAGVANVRAMGIAFGAPLLRVFAVMAGRGCSLPHWTACGWVALVPLAVSGVIRMAARAVAALLIWQGALLIVIVGLVLTGGPGSETGAAAISAAGVRIAGSHANPLADLNGWEAAALHGTGLAEQRGLRGLVVMNWSLASRIAWYARPMPVFVAPEHDDQFRLWFGSLRVGESAVVVDWSAMPLKVPVGEDGFATCRPLDQLPAIVEGRQVAHFNYLLCQGWRMQHR